MIETATKMAKKRDRIVNTQPFITDDASVSSSRKRSKVPKTHQQQEKLLEAGISLKTMKVALAQQKEIADEENAESNPIAAVFSAASALMVTVIIVPAYRVLKASPILGFFFAGVVLNQFGFIRILTDVKVLSEWGILFLLFEMGLELSLARLKALAKGCFHLHVLILLRSIPRF